MTKSPPLPPSWINRGKQDWPGWLAPFVADIPQPNGSFLISTTLGNARVHPGAMVFLWGDAVHTCSPGEAKAMVAELEAAGAPAPPPPATSSHARTLEADVADRRDDTDDITRRLRAEVGDPEPVPAPRKAPAKPQKTAVPTTDPDARKWPTQKGMPPSIENRHPNELNVDDSYQRSIDTGPSRALIKRIAMGWDWRKCLPLVVSKRDDGSLFVIDGQHRLAAAQLRGDVQFLPCCVAVYADVADEAAMFVEMNRERRAINRLDDFHAAQAGADPDALAIAEMVRSVGFTVSRRTGSASWAPGEVAFTTAIGKVRRRHGEALARQALELMSIAFAGQRLSAGSSVYTATCAILAAPPAGFNRDRMLKALGLFDMAGWSSFLSQTDGGSNRHAALRDMLLAAYEEVAKLREDEGQSA